MCDDDSKKRRSGVKDGCKTARNMRLPPDDQAEGNHVVEKTHAKEGGPQQPIPGHFQPHRKNNRIERNRREPDAQRNDGKTRQGMNRNTDKEKKVVDIAEADFGKFQLQNGDIVKTDSILNRYANRVSINGAVFHPGNYELTEGLKLSDLIKIYFDQDGKHVQFNVISREALKKAQDHPEEHRDLIVRVAGYSAYFVQLTKAIQDDVMLRTEHQLVG